MHSLDHQVLATLECWVAGGQSAWLCTIVATHGSSPRPAGSLMACNANGQVTGSLSGGCVEDDLLEKLRNQHYSSFPVTVEYGLSAEDNARVGLPCGGYLTVLVEKFTNDHLDSLRQINQALSKRLCIKRTVDLADGSMNLDYVEGFNTLRLDSKHMVQVYGPRYSLILVGAGQIAACLAQMASMMDYRVIVTDPRADKLDEFQSNLMGSSDEYEYIHGLPDDVVREYGNDPFSIVITLTHDPRIDDMALMEALTLNNFYVGSLGSVRTTEKRIDRLRQLDLSNTQISRLHAPVGLAIGSKTAPEIAVAILAELTQLRRIQSSQARGT